MIAVQVNHVTLINLKTTHSPLLFFFFLTTLLLQLLWISEMPTSTFVVYKLSCKKENKKNDFHIDRVQSNTFKILRFFFSYEEASVPQKMQRN